MRFFKKCYKNINEYLYEHRKIKSIIEYFFMIIGCLVSAFLFAYGFRAFIAPGGDYPHLVSGGASGLSQVMVKIAELCNIKMNDEQRNMFQSLFYFGINVPLFILAYFKIGKRFAILTFLNVISVSLFISWIPVDWINIFANAESSHNIATDILARALFAGILTGLSSSIAVKFNHSAGGIDILSIFISSKTHSSMGKYVLVLNGLIICTYTCLNGFSMYITIALYTIVYLFTSSVIIDTFCLRNKKLQLQIITSHEEMAKILISNFPHGCTVLDGKGAYKDSPRKVIYTDVSASEMKTVVKVVKDIDKDAFISVLHVHNVYGKFYIKPIK